MFSAKVSPYKSAVNQLDELVKHYDLPSVSALLGYFLAYIVDEKAELDSGRLYPDATLTQYGFFCMNPSIDLIDIERLVKKLNDQYPALQATITNSGALMLMLARRDVFIRLNMSGVETVFLPKIKELLPRLAINLVNCSFPEVNHKITKLHQEIGINTAKTNCFLKTTLATIHHHSPPPPQEKIPAGIYKLILDYLKLPVTSGKLSSHPTHLFLATLFLLIEPAEAKPIMDYCEGLYLGSATIEEKKETLGTTINIHSAIFNSHRFWQHYQETFQTCSLDEIEHYQQESGSLTKTTRECQDDLKQSMTLLNQLIETLSIFSEQHDKASLLLKALQKLVEQLQMASEKKVIQPSEEKISPFFLAKKIRFFTYDEFLQDISKKKNALHVCMDSSEKYTRFNAGLDAVMINIGNISKLNTSLYHPKHNLSS